MLKRFNAYYKKQQFFPGFFSIFINPFYFGRKALYKGIREFAGELTGVFMDFGCGSKPYKGLFDVEKYIGVDVEKSGHPHEGEDIDVFYDGKTLPFPDEYFDSAFAGEVFEHIFELEDIIIELRRVLKVNGKMLITVPFVWDEHEVPYDFGRYSTFGIKHLMTKNGFEVLAIKKSTGSVRTIMQMWNLYLYRVLNTRNKFVNTFFHFLFISPFTVLGIILSAVLPFKNDYYLNNILLVRKTER